MTTTSARRRAATWRAALAAGSLGVLVACAGGEGTSAPSLPAADPPPHSAGAPGGETDQPAGTDAAQVHPVTTVLVTNDPSLTATGSVHDGDWPQVLGGLLAEDGNPWELQLAAAGSAGLASGQQSFAGLVEQSVSHAVQLVILYDVAAGSADVAAVEEGAAAAFRAVERQAPDARVVLIAPWAATPSREAPSEQLRDALLRAVRGAEMPVTVVDPQAEGRPGGTGPQEFADLVHRSLAPLVEALARSGAFE